MAAVIPTNEELMIAMDTAEIVGKDPSIAARWGTPLRAIESGA
jgi:acetate kinase